ncbi:hypothetical protein FIBSPDRAFT_847130 [Athelia psychrophila]|uniref:Uncharacterized protein n=1 Tax=Athelia psychrophila TaxID=1759441 RepID=A0A166WQK0_9AGAM|nr:hypothetical protein FIBSPDRAFT_847130 [Fibularhizoctonia sp. CBS 109695]
MMADSGARSGSPLIFTLLAMQTEGYSAAGLRDLALRVMHQAAMRSTTPKDTDSDAAVGTLCQTLHMGLC